MGDEIEDLLKEVEGLITDEGGGATEKQSRARAPPSVVLKPSPTVAAPSNPASENGKKEGPKQAQRYRQADTPVSSMLRMFDDIETPQSLTPIGGPRSHSPCAASSTSGKNEVTGGTSKKLQTFKMEQMLDQMLKETEDVEAEEEEANDTSLKDESGGGRPGESGGEGAGGGMKLLNVQRMRVTPHRCDPPRVCGPGFRRGQGDDDNELCCDNLRCTACDCQVIQISGRSWKPEAEYIFFRNYYPNVAKLQAMLVEDRTKAAYCCQCSWMNGGAAALTIDAQMWDQQGWWKCFGH
uniref:Cilia- and flagella-associated protein 418 n=1 Tax=Chromera velia CCMP2878 TaxID=1169474 RepID=A0A0G4FU36_9ALVE|eukprot:Cvel_18782.t1-p1 / transcript=Cvel_18782.t1 / gene=Cvel_18782 / organism=Chromera_velia_CCMP2878 / gene_product=Protein C8orf37 homolog, putative / transcript_product=Protein C8orf37 homolog, putative / location=Cvel_scaffold1576:38021-41841(+) / protein_length=294 / sequence_SO=supercontig / SO=protein_coding / is_pseudo=false